MGAGLAPLWGGHILLPILGGGGRAGPFANLGGKKKQRLIPGLPQSPSCPVGATSTKAWPQEVPAIAVALTPGLPKPVFQALTLPGQGFRGRAAQAQVAPERAWLWEEVSELS